MYLPKKWKELPTYISRSTYLRKIEITGVLFCTPTLKSDTGKVKHNE